MSDAYTKFINGYSGQRLLEKNSLTDYGLWRVRGEDPNCDFGGHHHEPELGIFEGKLHDVIEYAVRLPRWYTWGYGGSIEPYGKKEIMKITSKSIDDLEAMRKERDAVKKQMRALENKLQSLKEEIGE